MAWTDIKPRGGATFIACDSVPVIARFLADHPEGIDPRGGFKCREMIKVCHVFVEMTGRIGDVCLLHPCCTHSQGILNIPPRIISNPPAAC